MLPLIRSRISSGVPVWPFLDAADAGQDLAGSAVAALEGVLVDERLLRRVQLISVREALDGGDLDPLQPYGECQAGVHPLPVDQHGARAARPCVAALLRAGQIEMFTQQVEERGRSSTVTVCWVPLTVRVTRLQGAAVAAAASSGAERRVPPTTPPATTAPPTAVVVAMKVRLLGDVVDGEDIADEV